MHAARAKCPSSRDTIGVEARRWRRGANILRTRRGISLECSMRAIRIKEVIAKVGLGQSTLYRMMAAGQFPKPFEIVPGRNAWIEGDIDEWLARRVLGDIAAPGTAHTPETRGQEPRAVAERSTEPVASAVVALQPPDSRGPVDIEGLARRIAARLAPHALWDLTDVAAYLHHSAPHTRQWIVTQDGFPRPIRLPTGKGATEQLGGLWRSKDVVAWAEASAEQG
jgi:predicted DNA-binding transcriptional regulator AlpA